MTQAPSVRPGEPPAAASTGDAAYLDFLAGMRRWQMGTMRYAVRDLAPGLVQSWEERAGRPARGPADAHAIFDPEPTFQWRHFFERILQEKLWDGTRETYERRRAELEAELDRTDALGPGGVEWDPAFPIPDYLTVTNYHLQPGGYHGDPLLGHVYHRGTDIYIGGRNTAITSYLAEVPAPPDGRVERILDLGCAIGQSATALKQRYPQAEVHAIDVSAPMVRYGHKRALELGIEVHFHQQSADDLQFADNSFDLVYAYILFHEVPVEVTRGTMREALRVLRPGGIFVINDVGPRSPLHPSTPLGAWMLDYAVEDNEDPFVRDFIALNLEAELVAAGFPPPSQVSTSEIGLGSKGLVVGVKA